MQPTELPCTEHRTQLTAMERRLAVLETVIGSTADDGIRGMLSRMSDQISALTTAVQAMQLAQARATGAFEGASWLWRIVWAVIGSAITAGVIRLLK